jgi:hypothetical protein
MRVLVLAASAALVITAGTAMAVESVPSQVKGTKHHHYRDSNAAAPEGSTPADTLGAHEAHLKNLGDSGYNPKGDLDAAGNVKSN